MKKVLSIWIIAALLLTSFMVFLCFEGENAEASTITVDDSGGADYTNIQDAINASYDGNTVYVYSGTYYENIVVNKSINLIGENSNTTIIDGGGNGDVINVSANGVNISGFMVTGCGMSWENAGIKLNNVQNCSIFNNNISSNDRHGIILQDSRWNNITGNTVSSNLYYGIYLDSSSENKLINNNASDNWDGIFLDLSSNCTITDNKVLNNWNGISFDESSNNTITKNEVLSNFNGITISMSSNNVISGNNVSSNFDFGIIFWSSSNNNIISNVVSNNRGCGIHFFSSEVNIVTNNNVSTNDGDGINLSISFNNNLTGNNLLKNQVGINLYSSSNNNMILGNTFSSNSWYGIWLDSSVNNYIYHNYIIDNVNQAYDATDMGNQWDNGYPSGGNYWSDFDEPSEGAYDEYNGEYQNVIGNDGIVDNGTIGGGGKNPYVIDSDSQDNYPLIEPYKNFIILKQGWNLISLPLIQEEQNLTKVLKSIEGLYDAVQWYNITGKKDQWKHYKVGKPSGNDLFEINEKMGFWIHIIQPRDTIFFYNGTRPTENQTITLHPGWNMVGYPSLSIWDRTTALNNLTFGTHVDAIWTYDSSRQRWEKMGPSDYFEIGRGYYIHAKSKCDWEVPL